jgi:CheY-like chemotaxis protein/signal transduction histidine kinase
LGLVYQGMGDKAKAAMNFEKSGEILQTLPAQQHIPELLQSLAKGFSEIGNFTRAFAFQKAYTNARDLLFNKDKATALLDLTTKYESEFSVREKNQKLATLESEKQRESMIRWLLLGLVIMAALALFLTLNSYRIKQKDNAKLKTLNSDIAQRNGELERLNSAILAQKTEISDKNRQLEHKNKSLDSLNERLVFEISERETSQKSLFNKDNFLASIALRMRKPLSEIVSFSHKLIDTKPRADQKDDLQSVQFAANNLLVLINDALNFSKIDAGKLVLENTEFKLSKVIQDVSQRLKETKNLAMNFDNSAQSLSGDSVRLSQILTYLLGNLNTFMPEHGAQNKLETALAGGEANLKFNIPLAKNLVDLNWLKRIFTEDNLLDNVSIDELEDLPTSELELMTARRLAELQNGKFGLIATDNEVSIVLELPYKMSQAIEKSTVENSAPKIAGLDDSMRQFVLAKRVLLVEDNKVNQILVANMLKKQGIQVTTANDGIEGLDKIAQSDFDLVLMDIQMPRMDGYRAVAEIRRMNEPKKANLPIIALTASVFLNEPEELLEKIVSVLQNTQLPDTRLTPKAVQETARA